MKARHRITGMCECRTLEVTLFEKWLSGKCMYDLTSNSVCLWVVDDNPSYYRHNSCHMDAYEAGVEVDKMKEVVRRLHESI